MLQLIKNLFGIGPKVNYAELIEAGATIVDVRSKGEYASGHVKGSVNIPLDQLSSNLKKLKGKQHPIITCCASGMRSAAAKNYLKSAGYEVVHNAGSWYNLNSISK
jgi:rhodanese-related sulfurtransferase